MDFWIWFGIFFLLCQFIIHAVQIMWRKEFGLLIWKNRERKWWGFEFICWKFENNCLRRFGFSIDLLKTWNSFSVWFLKALVMCMNRCLRLLPIENFSHRRRVPIENLKFILCLILYFSIDALINFVECIS